MWTGILPNGGGLRRDPARIVRRLVYRPLALDDLDAIHDFIASDNPPRALSYIDELRARCRDLREFPSLGLSRDDLGAGIRVYSMRGRVIVAYRVTEMAIEIVRVFSGGRDYEAILLGMESE